MILVGLLIISSNGVAQSDNVETIVKFHPLASINYDRPSITGTIEFLFNKQIGIELGYGRRYGNGSWLHELFEEKLDTMTVSFSGYTILLEAALYEPYKKTQTLDTITNTYITVREFRDYMGIAYRYIDDLYNTSRSYYDHNDTGEVLFPKNDFYAVKRNVHVLVFKAGSIDKYKYFSTELYYEIGIRYTNRFHINREFDSDKDAFDSGTGLFFDFPYKGFLPTLNFGLKINYQLF
ncbi:MAG: hypothetical protein V4642_16095 [Bacteroidota bacterium]